MLALNSLIYLAPVMRHHLYGAMTLIMDAVTAGIASMHIEMQETSFAVIDAFIKYLGWYREKIIGL